MSDKEIWRPVVGYENLYEVSNLGRVKSLKRKNVPNDRILKHLQIAGGYIGVTLCDKKAVKKCFRVHRLVAIAFIPNPESKPEVNHISGIKTDNRVDNLEWVTPKENMKHAFLLGLSDSGQNHSNAKLSQTQVRNIRAQYKKKDIKKKYV